MPEELKPVNLPGKPRNIVSLDNSGPAQLSGSIAYRQSKDTLESLFASVPVDSNAKQSTVYQSDVNDLLTGRYNNVIYGANNEDIHGRNQSSLDKAVNGTLKGVSLAATTFVGGLGTIYGIGKSFSSGKLSDIWKNEISEGLDEINKEVDNKYLPNYYTDKESNAAWYSSDNLLTTNFLFDKLIKNTGFAVGAIYSGNFAAKGIGLVGKTLGGMFDKVSKYSEAWKTFSDVNKGAARLFSQGKNIEAAEILKKGISTVADAEKASTEMLNISNKFLNIEGFQDFTRKSIMSVYSAAGESSFESIGTASSFRETKIQEFRDKWGFEPGQEEMNKIDKLSTDVGNASFMANMAVLSATEFTQLPYLMGSSYKAGKATSNAFKTAKEVISEEGKYIAKSATRLSKTKSFITSYIFDPKESLQEYLQTSIDVGIQDYYNKAYQGNEAKNLTEAFINAGTAGWGALKETLTSKEGGESILLGGVSGGLMQIKGKIQERKYKTENTNSFLNELNVPKSTFTDAFNDRVNSLQRGIVLQQKGEQVLENGDKLEFLDNKHDSIHNYLSTRIKYGRTDMVLDDIAERRVQSSTEENYKKLQTSGNAPMDISREDYVKKLNEFETNTKTLTSLYASTNLIYQGKVNSNNERIYSDVTIDKMVYASSKITDYDRRIPQLNTSLSQFGINTQGILQDIIKDNKPNKEATVNVLNQINNLDIINETKTELKTALSDIIELGTRRKLFIEQHNDIVENPSRYELTPEFGFGETKEVPVTVSQDNDEKPTKKLKIGKEYSLAESFRREGTQLQLAPKITVLSQTLGGELEVQLPNGKTSFMTPEEFDKYTISDTNNTSQEIADILDKAINTVLKDGKYDDVRKQLADVIAVLKDKKINLVDWINSLDNNSLIDDIEAEFNAQTKSIFETKEKLKKQTEQLIKNKEEINKQQTEITNDSGTIGTNDPNKDNDIEEEGMLLDAKKLFISGTTESEGDNYYVDENGNPKDPDQGKIHLDNSRAFLNNVAGFKNRNNMRAILVTPALAKSYGLEGLVQISYGKPIDSDVNEIKGINDVENGFIGQVFVEQVGDKLFFVDKEGNQIGEFGKQLSGEDLQKVIFQTMRSTSLTYANGTARYRKEQKAEAEAYAAAWSIERKKIFATEPTEAPTVFAFQVSRGIAIKTDDDNHVAGTLIDEKNEKKILATDSTLIQIPTAGIVAHQTGQINVPNGRPILVHKDNVEFLDNAKFSKPQAEAIYEVINQIATEINERVQAGKKVIINKKLSRFLQNVLYWKKGNTEPGTNQFNISEDGTSISFSGNTYSIPEIAERKDEIIEDIQNAFHNINNKTLGKEFFSKKFTEYYMKDGLLVSNDWTNYQTYLLSSKYPNGSTRAVSDTPLSTKVSKPTDEKPNTHKAKYATLVGLDLPIGVIAAPAAPKAPVAPAAPTGVKRKFDYEGGENIFTSPFGDIIFTVKEGEAPVVDENDETIIATRDAIIGKIQAKPGNESFTKESLIPQGMAFINAFIDKELKADMLLPKEAPIQPAAPIVSNIKEANLASQGTSIELEMIGETGKEFLLTIDRKGNISLFSEKQSDGSYKSGDSAPKEAIDKLYNKYVPEKTKIAINNWLSSLVGSWAAPETQDGKNYDKAEKELKTELSTLKTTKASIVSTTVVSDLEAKKADIENRRQQELRNIKALLQNSIINEQNNQKRNFYSKSFKLKYFPREGVVYYDSKDNLQKIVVKDKKYYITTNKDLKFIGNNQTDANIYLLSNEYFDAIFKETKTINTEDEINAKYDAELKALETTPVLSPLEEIAKLEEERDLELEKNANRYKNELAKLKKIAAEEIERNGGVSKITSNRIDSFEGLIASEKFKIEDEYKAKIDALKTIPTVTPIVFNKKADIPNQIENIFGKKVSPEMEFSKQQGDYKIDQRTSENSKTDTVNTVFHEISNTRNGLGIQKAMNKNGTVRYSRITLGYNLEGYIEQVVKDIESNPDILESLKKYGKEVKLYIVDDKLNYTKVKEFGSVLTSALNDKDYISDEQYMRLVMGNNSFGSLFGYKEELANLETPTAPEAPKAPGSFNVKNIPKRGDDAGFRKTGVLDRTDRMTAADIKAFKEWHAKNVPFIPFEILENIINLHDGEKAWGVFENGVAKFVRGGLRGTEYHEIFEAIWSGMLTKEQQTALIEEFRKKSGQFTDRESGRKYNNDDLSVTDKMIKERIADDFSDFRIGKLPARTLGEAVRNFFKKIMDFFKSFVAKPSLKEDLFKAIDTGAFKSKGLEEGVKSMPPEYRAAGHLTEEQTNNYVKDMTILASAIILGNGNIGEIDKSALYDLKKLTSDAIFNKIEERYLSLNVRQELGDIAWKELVVKTKQELKVLLKIDFNESDLVNINESETNKNDYAAEPFSIDYKKSAPIGIKFVTATLPETQSTNQENSNSFKLPKLKVNPKTETYSLVGYVRAFGTILDTLKNTTGVQKVVDKLVGLANQDSNYVRFFKAMGGTVSESDIKNKVINFKEFKYEDWRLFIEMMQTYTKQKPNAVVQYISQGQVYSGSAMVTGIVNTTTRSWIQNLIQLSKEPDSVVAFDKVDKVYKVVNLSTIPTNTPKEKTEFLEKLGIIFPIEAFNKLKEAQQKEFTNSVSNLKTYLEKAEQVMSIQKKTLDVASRYDELASLLVSVTHPTQETTRINLDGKQSNSYADNNYPSVFENEFNECATLEELLISRPELNDIYSRGSQLLKKGGMFFDEEGNRNSRELKVGYIEGTKNKDDNVGVTSVKLSLGKRFTQEINQNLLGNYYIMIPADGSTEWMMNVGNQVEFEDIEQGKDGWKKINEIFRGYLIDDVALALDSDNREQLRNVGDKGKDLRFFKDILDDKVLSKINELIANDSSQSEIEEFIKAASDDINASIKTYLEENVEKTKQVLLKNEELIFVKEENGIYYYKYPSLNSSFAQSQELDKNLLSEEDVTNILTFANANYEINNIEFHKILFGDPYQFAIKKGILDATKRFKSFFSPRRTTFDCPEFNTFLNEEWNKAGDIDLQPGEPGYKNHKSYMNTVTVSDVTIMGSVANMKNVSKEIKKAFAETNEGDASSLIMDGAYRELKMKNRQWTQDAENWHQWQMAYTRQNLPGFKYSDDARGKALEKHDISLLKKKEPKHTIEIIKPIVTGTTNGVNRINLVLDKFSQMPMYYSMIKGTNLEKLYIKMMKEEREYIIMISGRKVGAEALYDLYTKNGQFNDAAFNNNIEIPWKAYGIQVETTYEGGGEQTRGSQLTKIATLDLYSDGEPIGDNPERQEVIKKAVERNKATLDALHRNGYDRLLKRLGLEDTGGVYKILNKRILAETLNTEMLRRELSDNVKDSIQLDDNGNFVIPFEASTAYLQIKSILYSLIDKEITSPKMHGGSYVQAPVTLWENASLGRRIAIKTEDGYKHITRQEFDKLTPEQQSKVVLTDDTLKFYTEEEPWCEIMLPHWFKGKLGKHAKKTDAELIKFLNTTKEGKELLAGIGFRIPTQSLSSVESFRVKGFLPQYMGKTVVVPSEITTKSGSDFDIDKLNIYLKSIYTDKNGDIHIIKLKGTEEETKKFYANLFEAKLEKRKIDKAELFDALDILTYGLDDPKNLVDRYSDTLDALLEETGFGEDASDKLMKELEKLGDADLQAALKEKFANDSYRRALENDYYSSLQELLALPENFQRLISPVGDDGLKDIATELDGLRGYDENKIKNRTLDRNYMTTLRHAFVTAKKWVGIAAVNITGHSLTQKFQAYIDPARFKNVSKDDKRILEYGNGEILLDHNKLEKDGKSYISLSGRSDTTGEFISDGLSGFATTFVDVAKDPYILKIIKSDLAVGTFMFLRRVGVPKRQIVMFMNQPIIEEYLSLLDSQNVKTLFDTRKIALIKSKFPSTVTQAGLEGFNKSELEDNIRNYYSDKGLSDYKNFEQDNILMEFLKYAKMAEYSFKLNQASSYDTTKFQSGDSLSLKQWRTQTAQKQNIISSVGDLLNSTHIGLQAEILDFSMQDMGEIFPLEQDAFVNVTDRILKTFGDNIYLSKDKFDKIANKIKASFLDYIIQKRSDVAVNAQKELVSDKDSVAQMLVKAKQEFPDVQIIDELEIDSSGRIGGAQTIKLRVNDKTPYSENMYTGMMRELRDNPATNELYKGIVRLSILQGTYQSPISIKNIIPVEDYAKNISSIITGLVVNDEIEAFADSFEFQRNEWQDNDVVPVIEPRLMEVFYKKEGEDDLPRKFQGKYVEVGRGENKRRVPGSFPQIAELGVNTNRRHILYINAKYQAKASGYDVIKVPRTISIDKKDVTQGKIDIQSGEEITAQGYAERSKKGDLSLRNYYGYQRVKYPDGTPLIAYNDDEGNPVYVYKLINLHSDGQYATEHYGDGRPSIYNNGSEKNVKNIGGTIVSNELSNQDIIDYYEGTLVPKEQAGSIIEAIENEAENVVSSQPVKEGAPKGQMVKEGIYINQGALTKDEQLELFNYLKPFLEQQAAKTLKSDDASKMIGLGLRWDYKNNNKGRKEVNIPDVINEGNRNRFGYYNTSINGQTLGQITPRFRELIQKATNLDMTYYDGAIINLYDSETFISSHNDVDESKSAINYPVIGINLGGTGNFSIESRDGNPIQRSLKPGTAYIFGVNGKNRQVYHRTFPGKQDSFLPALTTVLDGKTYDPGSYRVTITLRRVMPLEPGMPTQPSVISTQPTQQTTTEVEKESTQPSEDRQIQVNQFTFTVKPDGSMFYKDGKELTDQTIKNKVNVRKELQDGTLRSSVYNGSNYFVLSDNRIVGSGTTNLGKESVNDPKIKESILAKAITYKKTC